MKPSIFCPFIVTALFLTSLAGCGNVDSEYRVTIGVVTYKAIPVQNAIVSFVPQDSSSTVSAGGITDASGYFKLTSVTAKNGGTGAIPGKYKISISKVEIVPDPDQAAHDRGEISYDELQKRLAKKAGTAQSTMKTKSLIPIKYNSVATSGLEVIIENKSKNEFTFDLVD